MNENHELLSSKNKKVTDKLKIETPAHIWINEFICLRSKMCAYQCGIDSKNKLKCFTKSHLKKIKFAEYKNCLDVKHYRKECGIYIIRSLNHELYIPRVEKYTLPQFDDDEIKMKLKMNPGIKTIKRL